MVFQHNPTVTRVAQHTPNRGGRLFGDGNERNGDHHPVQPMPDGMLEGELETRECLAPAGRQGEAKEPLGVAGMIKRVLAPTFAQGIHRRWWRAPGRASETHPGQKVGHGSGRSLRGVPRLTPPRTGVCLGVQEVGIKEGGVQETREHVGSKRIGADIGRQTDRVCLVHPRDRRCARKCLLYVLTGLAAVNPCLQRRAIRDPSVVAGNGKGHGYEIGLCRPAGARQRVSGRWSSDGTGCGTRPQVRLPPWCKLAEVVPLSGNPSPFRSTERLGKPRRPFGGTVQVIIQEMPLPIRIRSVRNGSRHIVILYHM